MYLHVSCSLVLMCVFGYTNCVELDDTLKLFVGTLERYANKPNDVVFVLDESGSIGAANFPQELTFTELTARILTISPDTSRAAVITFSSGHVIHFDYIKHTEGNNMCTFVPDVEKVPYKGGGTNTADGLRTAGTILSNARPNSNKIIILVSDGRSNEGGSPLPIATSLKNQGIIIFGVGVADVNAEELYGLSSGHEYVYILKNFLYIKEINNQLKEDIKELSWDAAKNSELCNGFCTAGADCCDINAACFCGTKGGKYECTCLPGYHGSGHKNECKACPKGTYSSSASKSECASCPDYSTTASEGSKSRSDCFCLEGYEGNPVNGTACKPVQCAKLAAPIGGVIIPNKCGNTFNSTCTFKCLEGYCPYSCNTSINSDIKPWHITPEEPRKCLETRKWSGVEFYCEKIKCPALNYPQYGNHDCSGSDFGFGTVCQMTCEEGFILHGSKSRQCQITGKWTGEDTICKAVTCPVLKTNKLLRVKPARCHNFDSVFGTVCQYFCKDGYKLISTTHLNKNETVGILKCLSNGKWHGSGEITCKDNMPPSLECPFDIQLFTDKNKPDAVVHWKIPNANDNVEVKTLRILSPPSVKKPPHSFNIGTTRITYIAIDSSELNSTCSFRVEIRDIEPPRIKSCPSDYIKFYGKNTGVPVTWEEPKFVDNSGKTRITAQTRNSGDEFSWGPPAPVVYKVSDPSGNTIQCKFNIIVKPYPCEYADPPFNGALACDDWLQGQICKISCEEGYDFIETPETEYFCRQLENKAQWGRLLPDRRKKNLPFKFPWPDCGKKTEPKSVSVKMKTQYYYSGQCTGEEAKLQIQQRFIELFDRFPNVYGFCPTETCIPKNVHVKCGKSPLKTNLIRRKREIFDKDQSQKQRTKRQYDDDNFIEITMEWDVILSAEDINLNKSCEDCEEKNIQVIEDALEQNSEEFQLKLINEVLTEYSPELITVKDNISFVLIPNCEIGQILQNISCVNCPSGTYYSETSNQCLQCPLGTFQNEDQQTFCKRCPSGMSTTNTRAKSVHECKKFCAPGTYSETGLEVCTACPNGTYQHYPQQTRCILCSEGSTTWTIGATSVADCTTMCPPGTFSGNGFHPCTPCPFGTYQPNTQQTECIPCPPGLKTRIEGAHIEQYCQDIDFCEEHQPCLNNGICMNTNETYQCLCPEGFIGRHCDTNVNDCAPDLCLNNGTCVDEINSFRCLCLPGFSGLNCQTNIDDCKQEPCVNGGTCIDGVNKFVCKCPNGFTGELCEINYYDCASNPCQNGGTCFDEVQNFRCCCPKGYTGKFCEKEIKLCDSVQCVNGGSCIDKFNNFECKCRNGFFGKYCEINEDDCQHNYCKNGATCIDGIANYTCQCPVLFSGDTCEIVFTTNFGLKFPTEVTSNYVILHNQRPLPAVTVSFWIRTQINNKNNRGTPISFSMWDPIAKKEIDNALTLLDVHKFILYLHGKQFHTDVSMTSDTNWHHCVITWESQTGNWMFHWDGAVKLQGSNLAVGGHLWDGYFVLGQEQDELAGSFSTAEAFLGEITQFNVWDHALSSDAVKRLRNHCGILGNVFAWTDVKDNIHGDVITIEDIDLCSSIGQCDKNDCYCSTSTMQEDEKCYKSVASCEPNPCANGQQCNIKNGIPQCNCIPGLEGQLCQYDINECLNNNGNCSHLCSNAVGSYTCSCPGNMKLSPDTFTCIDTTYCKDGGQVFIDEETWIKNCQECKCEQGEIKCSEIICPSINCQNGTEMLLPGKCCSECIAEHASCILYNNEFYTFDHFEYNFSGKCRYTLVDDCIDGQFSIRYEDLKVGSSEKVIYIYVYCVEVQILPPGSVFVNGEDIKLPYKNSNLINIIPKQKSIESLSLTIYTTHGIIISWESTGKVEVGIPKKYQKRVCGLCGNFNGKKEDDFLTKQHLPARTITASSYEPLQFCQDSETDVITTTNTSILFRDPASASAAYITINIILLFVFIFYHIINEFGLSWKTDGYKHCRTVPKMPGKSSQKVTHSVCKTVSHLMQRKSRKECSIFKQQKFHKCYRYVKPKPYYNLCLQDSCSCNYNEPCYCDTVSSYALECQRHNITIKHWTAGNKCASRCAGGMVYDDCGPRCHETCQTHQIDAVCHNEICVPGCYCPAGMVLQNGKCIPKTSCFQSFITVLK